MFYQRYDNVNFHNVEFLCRRMLNIRSTKRMTAAMENNGCLMTVPLVMGDQRHLSGWLENRLGL